MDFLIGFSCGIAATVAAYLFGRWMEGRSTEPSCPNCGQFCTGKTMFCNPPIEDDGGEARP